MPDREACIRHNRSDGTLLLVVGPSGAGKDTLIDAARSHFADCASIVFSRRYITRTDLTGENHIALSPETFANLAASGGFFLAWRAHGLSYGLPSETLPLLCSGHVVVANVSRQVVDEARSKWKRTHVILVTANPEVLRVRLHGRGRETGADIGQRLQRATEIPVLTADWISEVDNSGDLNIAVQKFNALIAETLR